jgi:hypothetical protein
MYIPFSLQRRFMLGIFIPLAGLAVLGLRDFSMGLPRRYRMGEIITLSLSFPTILLVVLSGVHGIQTQDPSFYLTRGEVEAMEWIQENTGPEDVILASPEMGLFIPAYTGRQVLYGHPFETVDAATQRIIVERFFQDGMAGEERDQLIAANKIRYIFRGPRELRLNSKSATWKYPVVYQSSGVTLYESLDGN